MSPMLVLNLIWANIRGAYLSQTSALSAMIVMAQIHREPLQKLQGIRKSFFLRIRFHWPTIRLLSAGMSAGMYWNSESIQKFMEMSLPRTAFYENASMCLEF